MVIAESLGGVAKALLRLRASLRPIGASLHLSGASFVHSSSVVDAGARVGKGSKIWHFSHVMSGAQIGENCIIGQNVFIGSNVKLGDRVKIQNNVSLYDGVHLEEGVFCGPSVVFTNVRNPRAKISRKHEFRATRVAKGATLGANCTIVCGNQIGRFSFVGAGAVVTKDVPDYALVLGVPARVAGWVCDCGERLRVAKNHKAICKDCGHRFLATKNKLVPSAENGGMK